ncbi:MAG: DUF4340 domain-containing protein [Dysosmobacter sp.]|uniref:DUF4340 domain-containing protein n=1 Tax=Dysosmobacter sp. TaxID=2591382 RepID=UPI00284787E9|nr:DUF4340 domain-containing protein [Dysosmobacter sp.]MDR3982673.1 DUF4340 domain-containing protein [Dysosmobacter sp.]
MNRQQQKLLRGLVIAAVVLLAVLAAVLLFKRHSAEKQAEEEAAQEAASAITEDHGYTSLTYTNSTATLSFTQDEDGSWIWADDPEFPLDDSTITYIIQILQSLKPQQTITDGDTLEAYGLDQPSATLTATDAETGETLKLTFGKATTDGTSYYMLMNDAESPVYIVSDTLYNYLSTPIYDMCVLPELPVLTEETLNSLTIQGAVETTLTAAHNESTSTDETDGEDGEETSSVTWTSGETDVTDNEKLQSLLDELSTLSFTKCADYKPSDEAVELCGFGSPTAVLTASYVTDSGTEGTLTLTLGTKNVDGDSYYARMDDDTTIYLLSASAVSALVTAASSGLGA